MVRYHMFVKTNKKYEKKNGTNNWNRNYKHISIISIVCLCLQMPYDVKWNGVKKYTVRT